MDNQHRKIRGYRELNQYEIDAMNKVKEAGAALGGIIEALRLTEDIDQRWVNIAETHLQEGCMALTRAIARPTFF